MAHSLVGGDDILMTLKEKEGQESIFPHESGRVRAWRVAAVWAVVVLVALLWQARGYAGIVAIMAEWQFRRWGAYYPVVTVLISCAVLSVPLILALIVARRVRQRRERALPVDAIPLALAGSDRVRRFLFVLAGVFGAAALYCVLSAFMLGSGAQAGTARAAADLRAVARFGESALLVRRDLYFAPVRGARGQSVRQFVEVVPTGHAVQPFAIPEVGSVQRKALPGEIVALYRSVGIKVADDHVVRFRSVDPLRWRRLAYGAQFALASGVLMLAGWLERRRKRRIAAARMA